MHFFLFIFLALVCIFLELNSIGQDIILLSLDSLVLMGQSIVTLSIGPINLFGCFCCLNAFFGMIQLGVAETHVEPGFFVIIVFLFQISLIVLDGLGILLILEAGVALILLAHAALFFIFILITKFNPLLCLNYQYLALILIHTTIDKIIFECCSVWIQYRWFFTGRVDQSTFQHTPEYLWAFPPILWTGIRSPYSVILDVFSDRLRC